MAFIMAGCSSSSNDAGAGAASGDGGASGACKVGINAPFAFPEGTPFALPAGIVLDGEITGDLSGGGCVTKSAVEYGGDLAPACLPLKNTTSADIVVKIPAGLTFIAKNPETQNGIVLQDHELTIPAQSSAVFHFRFFCLNEHCKFGDKADRFTFGNVTTHPKLLEIIALARTKELDKPGGVSAYVFNLLIWDVTDHDGITEEHRALLEDVKDL
jgi:hypothetical protein